MLKVYHIYWKIFLSAESSCLEQFNAECVLVESQTSIFGKQENPRQSTVYLPYPKLKLSIERVEAFYLKLCVWKPSWFPPCEDFPAYKIAQRTRLPSLKMGELLIEEDRKWKGVRIIRWWLIQTIMRKTLRLYHVDLKKWMRKRAPPVGCQHKKIFPVFKYLLITIIFLLNTWVGQIKGEGYKNTTRAFNVSF